MARSKRDRKPKFRALKEEEKPDLHRAEAIFSSAKIAAARAMRVCAPAIKALHGVFLPPGAGPRPNTFAVDKYYRVYINTDTLQNFVKMAEAVSPQNPCRSCGATSHHPIAYVGGALGHEAWHPLRQHFQRAIDFMVTNRAAWGKAIDEEINDDLMEIYKQCDMPRLCIPYDYLVLPERYGHEDGKLAEFYYSQHIENAPPSPSPPPGLGQHGMGDEGEGEDGEGAGEGQGQCNADGDGEGDYDDHGSGTDGQARPWDLGPPKPGESGLSEAEGRMIRKEVAKNINEAAKSRGNMPGGWKLWADRELEGPKYNWRQELAKAIRWSVRRAQGDEERTYRRLGRRCASLGYRAILPSTYRPCPIVAIVQDTSGSMGSKAIKDSLTEAEGIIRATGADVVFINCDMRPDKAQRINSVKDVDLHGGGGTDMTKGIAAALREKPKPNLIVLFTDGHTPWPGEPLDGGRVGLVVGLVGDHAVDVNTPPQWATVVKVIGDDVEVRRGADA